MDTNIHTPIVYGHNGERDRWSEANSRWQQLLSYCKCNNIKHPEYMDDSHEHCLFITTQTVLVFRGKSSKYIMTSENKYKEQKTTSGWWFLMTTDFSCRIGHFLLGRDTNNYLVLRQKQAEDTCVYSELFIYLRYKKKCLDCAFGKLAEISHIFMLQLRNHPKKRDL